MKSSLFLKLLCTTGLVLAGQVPLHAQHGHLNAGAIGTNQNDALIWANGADFVTTSGYVKTLDFTNSGRYAGYFQQNITLTALPATSANAGPDPEAPALGSFIQARMRCLEAPEGGAFAFWESGATEPSITVTAGAPASAMWHLTQGDGAPGTDPFGHVHGRRFTATKPGLYTIAFQALDVSTNGLGGGPIHTPSTELAISFQAGVNLLSVEPDFDGGHVHLRFAPPAGTTWQIEASEFVGAGSRWEPVGPPVTGNDLRVERLLEGDPGTQRFFRINRTAP